MADRSLIEWTDATWNPVRGCTKISPGCKNCYAETFAERFRGVPGHPYERGFDVREVPDVLLQPSRWTKARKIFVNSMSDLFHEEIAFDYIDQVVVAMIMAKVAGRRHTFQVLTKRHARMRAYLDSRTEDPEFLFNAASRLVSADLACAVSNSINGVLGDGRNTSWPLNNVWWGVSVEDRKYGLPRIDTLRQTPAHLRMLSIEPLLEDLGEINLDGIGWVIVGGESGRIARPMNRNWVRSIRDQCTTAGVPFFFKQWGEWRPFAIRYTERVVEEVALWVGKKGAGRMLDGRSWDEFPEVSS